MSKGKDAVPAMTMTPMKRKLRSSTVREETDTEASVQGSVRGKKTSKTEPKAQFEDTIVVSPRTNPSNSPEAKRQTTSAVEENAAPTQQDASPNNNNNAMKPPTPASNDTSSETVEARAAAGKVGGIPSHIPPERWAELSHKARRHARITARKAT